MISEQFSAREWLKFFLAPISVFERGNELCVSYGTWNKSSANWINRAHNYPIEHFRQTRKQHPARFQYAGNILMLKLTPDYDVTEAAHIVAQILKNYVGVEEQVGAV